MEEQIMRLSTAADDGAAKITAAMCKPSAEPLETFPRKGDACFLMGAREHDPEHVVVLAGGAVDDLPGTGKIGRQLLDRNRFDEKVFIMTFSSGTATSQSGRSYFGGATIFFAFAIASPYISARMLAAAAPIAMTLIPRAAPFFFATTRSASGRSRDR
jgi:hypothetical protein